MTLIFVICKCFGCTLSWWWMILFVFLDFLDVWYHKWIREETIRDIKRFKEQ